MAISCSRKRKRVKEEDLCPKPDNKTWNPQGRTTENTNNDLYRVQSLNYFEIVKTTINSKTK
jgi:hypothetical protein